MSDSFKRYIFLLRNIPMQPAKISAPELQKKLASNSSELEVDIRYIQRDLAKLAAYFPLYSTKDDTDPEKAKQKPYGWSWKKGADRFAFPAVDADTALTMMMAGEHLKHLMPVVCARTLKQHFKEAEEKLDGLQKLSAGRLRSWRKKVAAIPNHLSLEPPNIPNPIIAAVHDALLRDKCLEFTYSGRSSSEKKSYVGHPLGLVYRGAVPYLVAMVNDYEDVRQWSLARMHKAECLERGARRLRGFDLKEYVESGEFGILNPKTPQIKLKLKLEEYAANNLQQTPLSKDQVISQPRDGYVTVLATVNNTQALRSFILGYGSTAEVLQPKSLRQELAADLKKAAALYT